MTSTHRTKEIETREDIEQQKYWKLRALCGFNAITFKWWHCITADTSVIWKWQVQTPIYLQLLIIFFLPTVFWFLHLVPLFCETWLLTWLITDITYRHCYMIKREWLNKLVSKICFTFISNRCPDEPWTLL